MQFKILSSSSSSSKKKISRIFLKCSSSVDFKPHLLLRRREEEEKIEDCTRLAGSKFAGSLGLSLVAAVARKSCCRTFRDNFGRQFQRCGQSYGGGAAPNTFGYRVDFLSKFGSPHMLEQFFALIPNLLTAYFELAQSPQKFGTMFIRSSGTDQLSSSYKATTRTVRLPRHCCI